MDRRRTALRAGIPFVCCRHPVLFVPARRRIQMRSIVRAFPVLSADVDRRPTNGLPLSVAGMGVWVEGER